MFSFLKLYRLKRIISNLELPGIDIQQTISSINFAAKNVSIIAGLNSSNKNHAKEIDLLLFNACIIAGFSKPKIAVTSLSAKESKHKTLDVKRIIAVSACKGGVGKSTIACALAVKLASDGTKVGIADCDIYGPSIPMLMNSIAEKYNIKISSIGMFTDPKTAIAWRGPMAAKAINSIIFGTDWSDIDTLILDLPPGTGDVHLTVLSSLQNIEALLVTTNCKLSLAETHRSISIFEKYNIKILGLAMNMSDVRQTSEDFGNMQQLFVVPKCSGKIEEISKFIKL